MPRKRKRSARPEPPCASACMQRALDDFDRNRESPAAFWATLIRLERADIPLWELALLSPKPLKESEAVMLAQVVAPPLAGMTPGSVHDRHKRGS
jgi:hypothetical protein